MAADTITTGMTARGLNIVAQAQLGASIEFTKIEIGDGIITSQDPSLLSDLIHKVATFDITEGEIINNDTAKIGTTIVPVEDEFYFREIGIFAIDPSTNEEVLYAYGNSAEGQFIPAESSGVRIETTARMLIKIANADNVIIHYSEDIHANVSLSNLNAVGNNRLQALKANKDNGEILSDAKTLADLQEMNRSTFDRSKFTVVGSPTITDDGVASGFSSDDYIECGVFDWSKPFSIEGYCEAPANAQNCGIISFNGIGSDTKYTLLKHYAEGINVLTLNINENYYYMGYDETLSLQKFYWKLEFNGVSAYKLSVKDVGGEWISKDITLSEIIPHTQNLVLGYVLYRPFVGSIDLKQFVVKINDKEVFNGNKTGIDVIKADNYTVVGTPTISNDGVTSDFSSDDYIECGVFDWSKPFSIEGYCEAPANAQNCGILSFNGTDNTTYSLQKHYGDGRNLLILNINENYYYMGYDETLSLQKFYWKLEFDGVSAYKLSVKDVDGEWISKDISLSEIIPHTESLILGYVLYRPFGGSIDLNAFKIYIDGSLAYQPCLKIPYTLSKTGSKIVDGAYRSRVQDMYNQFGWANYFTLSNSDFTLPMGELYGLIQNAQEYEEIGRPIATLSNDLKSNEIWLEGAEVNKITYGLLYRIYGDKYNDGTEQTDNFRLPDFRNRVAWGSNVLTSSGSAYIEAGLPQHSHDQYASVKSTPGWGHLAGGQGYEVEDKVTGAANNSIYKNDIGTVQPPAIKVRVKTRYK